MFINEKPLFMNEFLRLIRLQFYNWKITPPNMIQRGVGFLTSPAGLLVKPLIKTATPLLESVLKNSNKYIADAIYSFSNNVTDLNALPEEEFILWLNDADKSAKKWVKTGIATLAAEGASTGIGGFAMLAVDIPASFGIILAYSNKIALSYQIDITTKESGLEILRAISAGSETTINGKINSVAQMKVISNILTRSTWKSIEKAPINSIPGMMVMVRNILKKLGINVSERKAAQLIPVISAVSGGAINAAWASDALEAVRQYSRMSVVEAYYMNKEKIQNL